MFSLKAAFASAAMLAGGLVASAPDTADAQIRFSFGSGNGYGYSSGYGGHGYGSNYGWGGRGNYGHGNSWGNYGGYGHRWHDTSHYDYHPTEIRRHGNHYHVQPGHYDFHRQGHWDHYGH